MAVETQAVPTRAEAPTDFTWDLTLIFPNDDAWERAVAEVEAREPEIAALQGTLAESPHALLRVLQTRDEVEMPLDAVLVYARMRKDSDGTDPSGQAMAERSGSLAARIGAAFSFVDPEILALPSETLDAWRRDERALDPYTYYLDLLSKQRPHVRSAEVESVMAQYRDVTRAPAEISGMLRDTDLTFPTIEDEDGRRLQLSNSRYGLLISSTDRRVRRDAFMGIYGTYEGVQRTLGASLSAAIRTHVLGARLRNYPSALAAALSANDVPTQVYRTLVQTIDASLPLLHRYMGLRRRLLGVDELHYYDLYAPLIPDLDDSFEYAEAQDLVRGAFVPLGEEYCGALEEALANRWIDVYENAGKRGGAYSGGGYTTPPYILMNYQNKLSDVYTLAHELGHSLHSYFTRRSQPYITGDYTIFVAEVASTLAEALLTEHLLGTRDDPSLRKHLLVQEIEGIRTTIFRQTMFAEFELEMHEMVERGEALTSDALNARFHDLVVRYHGPELTLDREVDFEWSRVPHFYLNFYVYQYATGRTAAIALARQILSEGRPAVERYLRFLRSGSSQSPIDLLREAGVDMTSPEPIQLAMNTFKELLDQLEAGE